MPQELRNRTCFKIQVSTLHDGGKQGIGQQIFNRKSISRKITHPQSLFKKRVRNFTLTRTMESTYLNTDICKFE